MAISPIQQTSVPGTANGSMGLDASLGSTLGGLLTAGANVYGAQNAAQAQTTGINAGIGTQYGTMGSINNLWGTQTGVGNAATGTLGSTLGVGGGPANYGNFYNMPGYQFAVNQGTQAIQRAAAAGGSAYTPNTLDAVGQYVTGTASQDYNTYVQQLLATAGLGSTANQNLTGANLQTGANISQLQQNSGNAQASGVAGSASAIGSALGGLGKALGGTGSIGSLFGGGGSYSPDLSGVSNAGTNYIGANTNYGIDPSQFASNSDVMNNLGSAGGVTTYFGDNSGP